MLFIIMVGEKGRLVMVAGKDVMFQLLWARCYLTCHSHTSGQGRNVEYSSDDVFCSQSMQYNGLLLMFKPLMLDFYLYNHCRALSQDSSCFGYTEELEHYSGAF